MSEAREEHYAPASAGLRDSTRGARVTRAAPHPGKKPPPSASPDTATRAAPTTRRKHKVDVLLACAYYQFRPRLRAHRLVRASGRAAAVAAQPAGTMAPFARNDKTVLEIALPALVGCNAGVF